MMRLAVADNSKPGALEMRPNQACGERIESLAHGAPSKGNGASAAAGFSVSGLAPLLVSVSVLGAVLYACLGGLAVSAKDSFERIAIDYPLDESVFPPDMTAPTFLWRDPAANAVTWQIVVSFADGSTEIHVESKGEPMRIGQIDPRCVSATNKLPELTPDQAQAHTWKPDDRTWTAIKRQSGKDAVTIAIRGYAAGDRSQPVSQGVMRMLVSADPVNAPIFYRDVPLMPSETEKGFIKPLAASATPLIAWRMRNVADASSHVVMTGLHTCANCHSFAADGKTLGLDMDGPQNDKGLYAMAPVAQKMTIRTQDMVSWSSFRGEEGSQLRVGFMSQVSPDGRYVVTTIRPPGTRSSQFYYVSNFKDYRFLQVFYPTRGILAWYDRAARRLKPLPGASDPRYIQSNAVWSPDGKYLVFSRAEAKDPFREDGKMAAYANDPLEVQIQYDLYRIPFNDGKGGNAERIEGASRNGMSNSFPKVSPDGKWIVFVEARNGQLMRPDGKLYIVPAAGGAARRMTCNTPLMNSWHSFSPNGHWIVFSSKSQSPYTQMFLTHIDAEGNDTPAILIENSTAANRAVNIPEFVNMEPRGIEHIDTPAVDFYKQYDVAADLAKKGQYDAAIPEWLKAVAMSPGDARAHNNFGQTLSHAGKTQEAIEEYQKSIAARPNYPEAHNNLAIALAGAGKGNEAIEHYRLALEQNPGYAEAHSNLGRALAEQGRLNDAIEQYEEAISIKPEYAEAHNNLGFALTAEGRLDEAVGHYRQAIESDPKYAHAYNNLGLALAMQGKLDEALGDFSKAVELGPETAEIHDNLGVGLAQKGRIAEAVPHFERAIEIAPDYGAAHSYLGTTLLMKGQKAEALRQWRLALRAEPDDVKVLNDTAWLLSTSADSTLRNGSEAVLLAGHAVELTRGHEPMLLGTLAAAYAENGDFDRAVETQQRAAELADQQGNARLAAMLKGRLATLQGKTAIRER